MFNTLEQEIDAHIFSLKMELLDKNNLPYDFETKRKLWIDTSIEVHDRYVARQLRQNLLINDVEYKIQFYNVMLRCLSRYHNYKSNLLPIKK